MTARALQHAHPAQPQQTKLDELLGLDDGSLGASVVAILCSNAPTADNFAALGRMVRAGSAADLAAIVTRRRGR